MKTIAQKAADYLRSINETGVMSGDLGLLHEIAEICGIKHRGYDTTIQVLNAIDRGHKDIFEKNYIRVHVGEHNRETLVRNFDLIEQKEKANA